MKGKMRHYRVFLLVVRLEYSELFRAELECFGSKTNKQNLPCRFFFSGSKLGVVCLWVLFHLNLQQVRRSRENYMKKAWLWPISRQKASEWTNVLHQRVFILSYFRFVKCLHFFPQIFFLNPVLSSTHLNNYMPGSIPKTAAASPMMGCQDEKAIKKIQTCKESITIFLNACCLQTRKKAL